MYVKHLRPGIELIGKRVRVVNIDREALVFGWEGVVNGDEGVVTDYDEKTGATVLIDGKREIYWIHPYEQMDLIVPVDYDMPFPVFTQVKDETHYQTYHRAFREGWLMGKGR